MRNWFRINQYTMIYAKWSMNWNIDHKIHLSNLKNKLHLLFWWVSSSVITSCLSYLVYIPSGNHWVASSIYFVFSVSKEHWYLKLWIISNVGVARLSKNWRQNYVCLSFLFLSFSLIYETYCSDWDGCIFLTCVSV